MTDRYRALLAVVNLALVGALGWLGWRTVAGGPVPPHEVLPASFDPIRYDIPSDAGPRSSISEHQVTWAQLDRPAPPPVAVQPVAPPPTIVQPQDLSGLYSLLMVSVNEASTDLSSFAVQGRDGQQKTLYVGESFDGFTVLEVAILGEGDQREAVVTLEAAGRRETIRLKRKPGQP